MCVPVNRACVVPVHVRLLCDSLSICPRICVRVFLLDFPIKRATEYQCHGRRSYLISPGTPRSLSGSVAVRLPVRPEFTGGRRLRSFIFHRFSTGHGRGL